MLQMQHNKKTGIFYLLNEYGDMSVQEYIQFINKGTEISNNKGAENSTNAGPKISTMKTWTPSKERSHKLSGVEEMEALPVSQKNASVKNQQQRENNAFLAATAAGSPNQTSLTEDGVDREQYCCPTSLIDGLEVHYHLMNGIASSPDVVELRKDNVETAMPAKESTGYAVVAELVFDAPRPDNDQDTACSKHHDHSTSPRVKPPPKVQVMGTSKAYNEKEAPRQRPGTLESKNFRTVKGTPSNKSFFSGIGTQFVGVSTNKRLVRWEPGMEE
jgi:hypothetical protein